MTDPSVGVVIPVYNRADLIVEAIDSVREQTHPVSSLVIVDDGSQDSTGDRVKAIAATDLRVALLQQPNAGPSAARNLAISHLDTELVTFMDSDDLMTRRFAEPKTPISRYGSRRPVVGLVYSTRWRLSVGCSATISPMKTSTGTIGFCWGQFAGTCSPRAAHPHLTDLPRDGGRSKA